MYITNPTHGAGAWPGETQQPTANQKTTQTADQCVHQSRESRGRNRQTPPKKMCIYKNNREGGRGARDPSGTPRPPQPGPSEPPTPDHSPQPPTSHAPTRNPHHRPTTSQDEAARHSAPQRTTVQRNTTRRPKAQHATARRDATRHRAAHHCAIRRNTARPRTDQHNAARQNTTRRSTAHHNTPRHQARDANQGFNQIEPRHTPEGTAAARHTQAKGHRTPGNNGGGRPTKAAAGKLKPAPRRRRDTANPGPDEAAWHNRPAGRSQNLTRQEGALSPTCT